jgi:hypothetical protein
MPALILLVTHQYFNQLESWTEQNSGIADFQRIWRGHRMATDLHVYSH